MNNTNLIFGLPYFYLIIPFLIFVYVHVHEYYISRFNRFLLHYITYIHVYNVLIIISLVQTIEQSVNHIF